MSKNLQEIADFYPTSLELYGFVEGLPIHSNTSIEDRVIDWCYKSEFTKKIAPTIEKKIKNRTIIIGYLENKPLTWFWTKFKNWIHHTVFGTPRLIMNGYFSPDDDRIVILLDDNVNVMGTAVRNIPNKLVHELVHYIADANINKFLSVTTNKYLLPYYKSVLNRLDPNLEVSDDDLRKAIIKIGIDNEGINVNNPNIYLSGNTWYKLFLKYEDKSKSLKYMNRLSFPYLQFIVGNLKKKYLNDAYQVLDCYYYGYLTLGFDAEDMTVPGQEFRFPSEVVAISNEYKLNDRIAQLINSM